MQVTLHALGAPLLVEPGSLLAGGLEGGVCGVGLDAELGCVRCHVGDDRDERAENVGNDELAVVLADAGVAPLEALVVVVGAPPDGRPLFPFGTGDSQERLRSDDLIQPLLGGQAVLGVSCSLGH